MAIDQNASVPPGTSFPTLGSKAYGRSMMGKQADSKKASAPVYSFDGKSERETVSKQFLSTAHVNVERKCTESPGAIYAVPSSLDKQADKTTAPKYSFSKLDRMNDLGATDYPGPGSYKSVEANGAQPQSLKLTLPRFSFSSSTSREQVQSVFLSAEHTRVQKGQAGPDPGTYNPMTSLGQQAQSNKRTLPSFTWSHGDKLSDRYEKAKNDLPSVGQYETWHAMGKQPLSAFKTLPAWGFGSSSFEKEGKRFLTAGHSRVLKGTGGAGFERQTEQNLSAFGKQQLSHRSLSPSHRFGNEPKMLFKASMTPGPGSYD